MTWLARLATLLRPRVAPTPRPPVVAGPGPAPDESAMLAELNARRLLARLPPLAESPGLMRAAAAWAVAMARSGRLSHDGFAGRVQAAVGFVPSGEVVAQGQPDAARAVADWMASPGHRANLLGPYNAVGWGVASGRGGPYWCAIFAGLGEGADRG